MERSSGAHHKVEEAVTNLARLSVLGVLCVFGTLPAQAQHAAAGHQMTSPAELKWSDVAAMPGAQIAVIQEPMNEAVPFVARIKFPANTKMPPHSHSAIEHATVLSGALNMGVGDKLDPSKTRALGPGSVSIMQPGTNHFAWFGDETVLQLHGTGPWTVTYVNATDDTRK
jgi:quercetin dioxygenase-like cupin family protein